MPLPPRTTRLLTVLLLAGVAVPSAGEDAVSFNRDVRPIFVRHCLACHGGVKQAGGLSLVWRESALGETDSGGVIEPGDSDASYLVDRVEDEDDETRMPPPEHGPRLTDAETATLRRWIEQGAAWEKPWAFQAPEQHTASGASESSWALSPIDRFVLRQIEDAGLRPAREADRAQWLRRVSFDLAGLPPTGEEIDAFLADAADGAHERVVERLLASPRFGERWASVWLDLARYADTMGFERDPARDIWPYRDWVVESLNADMPYDEFLLKQFAGDLLPGATIGDRLATAFHRNSQTNTEGGTDDEEFRLAAVVDRVDSTWQGVLGLTFGCARCHDHPYDPITQRDYYRFLALLNSTRDADLVEDWPKLAVPNDQAEWAEADAIDAELLSLREARHALVARATDDASWRPIAFDRAESTGETRLETREPAEVVAVGTVTDRSRYTLDASAPAGPVTALRLDAMPIDPTTASAVPEMGFVLSRLRVFVERASGMEEEFFFAGGWGDEAAPFFAAADSLRDNPAGWAVYTRLRQPRWAVFALDEPVRLGEGDRLRVELKHDMNTDGQGALVLHRFRVSTTADAAWPALVTSPDFVALAEREAELLAERGAIESTDTPVLQERPTTLTRATHLLDRGNWLSPTDRLTPGVPETLPGDVADRLALAVWLGSGENPLTARVIVNRVWAELFGAGLIETLDDFGSTGAAPSHPQLLDDLAARLRDEFGWSLKRLMREVVLSATYRQDARATAEAVERDPRDRYLARGPRGRLRAEMVRDQALVLSGRMNAQVGGPPVMPYQPDGVWQTVFNNRRWETSTGPDRFRRAVYTYWKRTAGYPSLVAFDVPTREQCTARRPTTNTPLQALVTLNDPAFVELAEGFADRMLARNGETTAQRLAWATREATSHPPTEATLAELVSLHDELTDAEQADERFALSVVAGVIMNLDAALTK